MNQKKMNTTRREFLAKSGVVTAGMALGAKNLSAIGYRRVPGANDKIRVGFIGVGNRGTQLLQGFMEQADCEVAALCDVYEPYILRDRSRVNPRYIKALTNKIPQMGETFPNKVERYNDYRKLLENKSIDAVCIATPDHWHALQTIHSIQAGKDVYVEKPLSKTIHEGRVMINAAKKSKQVVVVGLNRRASSSFQKLSREIPAGKVGKVSYATACHVGDMYPVGIGKLRPEDPPKDLNWDAWLGPRAYRPYQYNIAPYMFRWWEDYCNQICNQGVHYLDLMRWLLNEKAPIAINAMGGKYALDDDRTIPDTMQATFEFGSGKLISVNIMEGMSGSFTPYGFIEFRATNGNIFAAENDYKVVPAKPGQFQTWDKLMEAEEFNLDKGNKLLSDGTHPDSMYNLVRNFLDCIKSRKEPYCTLEEGHLSTTMAHLATISLITKERLNWDPVNEKFTNSEKANSHLHYEYRKPWSL